MRTTVDLMVQANKVVFRRAAGDRMNKMQSGKQCRQAIYDAYENHGGQLVFDLGSLVKPKNVPISVSKCSNCRKTIINTLGQQFDSCPDCDTRMEDDLLVYMVTLGDKVLYRWEESCG